MLVDSHCHLDFPDFAEDRAGVIRRAQDRGVVAMVTISTRIRRFDAIRAIAEAHDPVFCSVGTHPHNADEERGIDAEHIIALADHPKVVAIGEAGLDYHYDKASRSAQEEGFRIHIDAARRTGLPLVIHARNADEDVARILTEETTKGAFPFVLHCFSSGADLARTGLDLGGYVSFSGIVTFKNSQELRDIAMTVPRDRILVETDAPYLAPVPMRGKTNEPAHVRHTAESLALTLGTDFNTLARQTTENFLRLFSKVPESAVKGAR